MFTRRIDSAWLIALIAAYFTTVMNMAFWGFVRAHLELSGIGSWLFAASMPVVLFLIFYAAFSVVFWPYAGKALVVPLLVLSAAANYFMIRLNVLIDSEMIRNVFEAKPHEVTEMVTLGGIGWVAFFGVLPAAALVLAKVAYRPLRRELALRGLHVLVPLLLLGGLGFYFYKDYASAGRNNKNAGRYLTPFNYIFSTRSYFRKLARKNRPFKVIDEAPEHVPYEDPYYTVLILMIGETARAMNFSLNGYARETNPKLSRQDIVNFPDVVRQK